jgi:hypothetical protein
LSIQLEVTLKYLTALALSAAMLGFPLQASASTVTFAFTGVCAQACSEVLLSAGQPVSGTLKVDSAFLPTTEGASAEVQNSNLLDLHFTYGSQVFSISDVVAGDKLIFTHFGGVQLISNGVGLLARNSGYELLIAPAGAPHTLPTVGAWLYDESVASWGTFTASAVPEPSQTALLGVGALLLSLRLRTVVRRAAR